MDTLGEKATINPHSKPKESRDEYTKSFEKKRIESYKNYCLVNKWLVSVGLNALIEYCEGIMGLHERHESKFVILSRGASKNRA